MLARLPSSGCHQATRVHAHGAHLVKRAVHRARVGRCKVAQAEVQEVQVAETQQADVPSAVHDDTEVLQQVQSLLRLMVEETEIAEMNLHIGTVELKVRRGASVSASGGVTYAAAPAAAAAAPASPATTAGPELALDEATLDETTIVVPSPKVGIFRRGNYAGGKRVGKGTAISLRDAVKKDAVLGYVEQLGTHVPVKTPQAGEIVTILLEDGAAVEYGQGVVEIAPYFGGHIIGDKKYA